MTIGHNDQQTPFGVPHRHSGVLLAGIHKSGLDTGSRLDTSPERLCRYDEQTFIRTLKIRLVLNQLIVNLCVRVLAAIQHQPSVIRFSRSVIQHAPSGIRLKTSPAARAPQRDRRSERGQQPRLSSYHSFSFLREKGKVCYAKRKKQ
jgi:hypothetical protein